MRFDLASLGWDAAFDTAYPRHDLRPGRVVRVDRGVCTVLCADGTYRASLAGAVLAGAAGDPARLPCAGDWVLVRVWPDDRVTAEVVLPRRTAIVRRTAGKAATGQVLAANLDAAAVVEPMHPTPDMARIERLLALAWASGAEPLVVLTKCDLVADPAAVAAQVAEVAPGVPVLPVSAQTGDGLADLRPRVAAGRTLALLGPSGAGKSTLVNALAGATVMVHPGDPGGGRQGPAHHHVPGTDPDSGRRRGAGHPGHPGGGAARRGRRAGSRLRRRGGAGRRLPVRRLRAPGRAGLRGPGRPGHR